MAIPSMLNLMVVPIVNAVDTYYVGQLADPFALAAQVQPINVSSQFTSWQHFYPQLQHH